MAERFCVLLKSLRKKKGLSQAELADELGTTRQVVQRWEKGLRFPRWDMLDMLREYFDCQIPYPAEAERTPPNENAMELRRLRHSLKFTQTQMGRVLHVSASSVSNWERGICVLSDEDLMKVRNFYGSRV